MSSNWKYLPVAIIGGLSVAIFSIVGIANYLSLDRKLDQLYEQGKYEEFYSALHDGGPKYFLSEKYASQRLVAFEKIKVTRCQAERSVLVSKLEALEKDGDYKEMLKVGSSCAGTTKEIDGLLELAKNPDEVKFARMTHIEHLKVATNLLTDNSREVFAEEIALQAAAKHLTAAHAQLIPAVAGSIAASGELIKLDALLEKKRVVFVQILIARGREDDAQAFIRTTYGSETLDAKSEVKRLASKIAGIKVAKAAALNRAEFAEKRRKGVSIGMSQKDVEQSNWGKPQKINRTVNGYGVSEQWVYSGGYLYFENGILTSIQN